MAKLLVVDDERWTRELIKHFAIQAEIGIEVVGEADNGEDGCRLIRELRPDIVITDMKMPMLDGIGLLHFLEEDRSDLKIIVLSGYDDFQYTRQAIRSGATEYLLKPVDPGQLKQALLLCLEDLRRRRRRISDVLVTLPPEMLAVLNDYRKNAAAYLNGLAAAPVEKLLAECVAELDSRFACDPAQWLRVYREFLTTLEQFAAMEGLELSGILQGRRLPEPLPAQLSASDVLSALQGIYREAIDGILERRKVRKKVDLRQIRDYVQQHYAEGITLESLAQRFYVSKEYLSKSYKLQFGENVTEQILRLRMQSAQRWLMQDGLPIKHIASRVGYEDVSYFHKVFKKYYGVSPAEMRMKRIRPTPNLERREMHGSASENL